MKKWFIFFILLLLSFSSLFLWLLPSQFKQVNQLGIFNKHNKAWSHRGVSVSKKEENSLKSIQKAVDSNYGGVEIDIWFENDKFYLSHEKLLSDSLPTIEMVFKEFPNTLFWLDLKNLSIWNVHDIKSRLQSLEKNSNTYCIESKNSVPLAFLSASNFYTCLWLRSAAMPSNGWMNKSKKFLYDKLEQCMLACFDYNGVSMSGRSYIKEQFHEKYKHLNVQVWTDSHYESTAYQKLNNLSEISIILIDQELSQIKEIP